MGLNEPQHRLSFHSDISFQMGRFLIEGESPLQLSTEVVPSESKFLQQDMHIQSQRRVKRAKKQKSIQDEQSSSSGDGSIYISGGDPTVAVGTQFDQGGWFENGYPMTLSAMSTEDRISHN